MPFAPEVSESIAKALDAMKNLTSVRIPCQFGSGSTLTIGRQSAHAVIGIDEGRSRCTVALTPEGMRNLASALIAMADQIKEPSQ